MTVNKAEWEWFGHPGHFICARWCRFHMTTKAGAWLVSTVGEMVPPHRSGGSEATEAAWLKDNYPGEDIGYNRKYETMVFLAGAPCSAEGCNCGLPFPEDYSERDALGANDAATARANHLEMCHKWADTPTDSTEAEDGQETTDNTEEQDKECFTKGFPQLPREKFGPEA